MNSRIMVPLRNLVALFGILLVLTSCGGGSCSTCGTANNGTIGLLDIMYVPEHNPTGTPGGPFVSFDIGWVDPVNRNYAITDRLGVDVVMFSTTADVALFPIGGDNTIAENGNDASKCWMTAPGVTPALTIPPIVSAQGNYQRFGCKSNVGAYTFLVPSIPPGHSAGQVDGSGNPNPPHFGGFVGPICCTNRGAQINPLSGPNGVETSFDGRWQVVSNGSSELFVFDLQPMLSSGYTAPPLLVAAIPTGTTGDFDGPGGIAQCNASAQNRAFTDPTCGDLRADELGTTGGIVGPFADGQNHFLVAIINGDPGQPFVSVIDLTQVMQPSASPTPLQALQQHCLPYTPTAPFSPGGPVNAVAVLASTAAGGLSAAPANFSSCILGQIYYDGSAQNDISAVVDNGGAANPCPFPTVQYYGSVTTASGVVVNGLAGQNVPSGASGTGVIPATAGIVPSSGVVSPAGAGLDVPCHHGPMLSATGVYCAQQGLGGAPATTGCSGSVGPAGLGGLAYFAPDKTFLQSNGNSVGDVTVGSVDKIDPIHRLNPGVTPALYGPVVVNSFPIYNCMPTGVSPGPGTDVLISCADHDGRAFSPSAVIINGVTGEVLTIINNIGYTDQTWYNPGDNNYYLASGGFPTGPKLGVINAGTRQWLQNVPTQGNTHSVAVDPVNNHIFTPLGTGTICQGQSSIGCVGVFGAQ